MNTTENNKLIAEFMGYPKGELGLLYYNADELGFHTSWDWLVPVIKRLKTALNEIDIDIFDKYVAQAHRIEDCVWDNDVSSAYEEVVEVIKAYNKTKSS